jgi:hypothetical protein
MVLALLAVVGWFTRDRWMSKVTGKPPAAVSTAPQWEPLTPAAGLRGKRAIEGLASPGGPVFANLRAGEVASYVFQTVGNVVPASADSAEAAVNGDALCVRAVVPMKDLAGSGVLGPIAGLLSDRERLSFCGAFRVVRPGVSEFAIREIRLRDLKVPSGAIPRLLQQISRGKRPEGVAPDAIPVPTPRSLADVRIANHRVTLYKTTPGATQ